MIGSQRPDRDALIEAVAAVMRGNGSFMGGWHADYCEDGQCGCDHEVAAEILVAVLPLIADAIDRGVEPDPIGDWSRGMLAAARLVRSLTHDRPETGE